MPSDTDNIKQVEGLLRKSDETRKEALFPNWERNIHSPNGSLNVDWLTYNTYPKTPWDKGNIYSAFGGTYIDYINEAYGENGVTVNTLESLLQGVTTDFVLRTTEVGVVSDIKPELALTGAITTNPNHREAYRISNILGAIKRENFNPFTGYGISDTDTRLGIISNSLYSRALLYGANANSARGRGEVGREFTYLTPYLAEQYGNNLATFKRLSDILWIDNKVGRTRDDLGLGVEYGVDFEKVDENGFENGGFKYLLEEVRNTFINPEVKKIYTFGRNLVGREDDKIATDYVNTTYDNDLKHIIIDDSTDNGFNGIDITANYTEYDPNTQNTKRVHVTYNEGDGNESQRRDVALEDFKSKYVWSEYDTENFDGNVYGGNNLLKKTNDLFKKGEINTMIARFHLNPDGNTNINKSLSSAYDETWGFGHGRTLLKSPETRDTIDEGYTNPYCRSWNYHHQYMRYRDGIRPFTRNDEKGGGTHTPYTIKEIQENVSEFRSKIIRNETDNSIEDGGSYLGKYTVLGNNGFVKIGPYETDYRGEDKHNYMLSIENLAWKSYPLAIESHRRGPNGGRIMWFPPYGVEFQENVAVEWTENSFIGRGEKIYTYTNTNRTASLGFTMLIDHPSILDKENFKKDNNSDVDDRILRYFAGCQDFVVKPPVENDKEVKLPEEKSSTDVPQEAPGEGGEIVFGVFFPNNYSGNMRIPKGGDGTANSNRRLIEERGYSDNDWIDYLLYGYDTAFKDGQYKGYEMKAGVGISSNDEDASVIYACEESFNANADYQVCKGQNSDERRRFRYRVDFDLKQNMLQCTEENNSYQDKGSTSFNVNKENVIKNTNNNFNDVTNSFAEVILALYKLNGRYDETDPKIQYIKSCGNIEESDIDSIANVLKGNVNQIIVQGGATNQDIVNTEELAYRRGRTVGRTLLRFLETNFDSKTNEKSNRLGTNGLMTFNGSDDLRRSLDINSITPKYQRSAKVRIIYGNPSVSSTVYNETDVNEGLYDYEETNSNSTSPDARNTMKDKEGNILSGYEYEYFKELEVNDPVIFKKIHDKFKYFDPAFHSMSPEGFNARLNFLHQCTRQGHTISASDVNNSSPTAGNLAFGRMPVCVLKIGDFINIRIIIQSMTLQYSDNGIQWDLNPEGIGVQPIFCKVTMNVILIGGSALNGPVNRLQNAQTFNYYSNTGVYDPRADRIEVDKDGKGITYKYLYNPSEEREK